jgi:hypothetical protein
MLGHARSAARALSMGAWSAAFTQASLARETEVAAQFTDHFPGVAVARVPAQPTDVHDLAGLRTVGSALADE